MNWTDKLFTTLAIIFVIAFTLFLGHFLFTVNEAMTTPADHAKSLKKGFPNSTVVFLDGAGCDCYRVTDTTSGATWIASWVGGELTVSPITLKNL